jgi:FkbM family methyltransferase
MARLLYKKFGLTPENFLVNRRYNPKVGKLIDISDGISIPIMECESYIEKNPNTVMVLGVPQKLVPHEMMKNTALNIISFSFSVCLDGNNYLTTEYLKENGREIDETFSMLSDRYSQECYIKCLESRITGHSIEMEPAPWGDPPYLLDDLMEWHENEVFIDGGAFVGDFIDEVYGKMPSEAVKSFQIYSFETEAENYRVMFEKLKEDSHVKMFNKGISSHTGVLYFKNDLAENGSISDEGDVKIEVDSIDNVLGAQKATFIKMDIEGSELDGLKGARKQIVENKPRLAVCLYHKQNDMFEIPLYIKSLRDDYKFYVRPHSSMPTELVLYAI